MPIYDSVHIRHRAVAYLHIISVEKFVEFVAFRKVLVDELQELLSDFCRNAFAIRGAVP